MFGTDLIKLIRRCLLVYSIVLFSLGVFIGFALKPSYRPERREYPAQFEPDTSPTDSNRHA